MSRTWHASDLAEIRAVFCTGQCCDLKVDRPATRVWLCRVGGGVTVEIFDGRRWEILDGSCTAESASD